MLCGICLASCQNERTEEKPQAYPVLTTGVSSVETTDYYPASIQGRQDIEIYPQVSGKIVKVAVTEGERVRRGQTLFIIDHVPYQAALETAVANVEAARANVATLQLTYDGKKELFGQKVISQFELSTAENAFLTAMLSSPIRLRKCTSSLALQGKDGVNSSIPQKYW